MKSFEIERENGRKIPCITNIPKGCRKIVILIHGMCSNKKSNNNIYMMDFLSQKNIGTIAYDQPGHGENKDEELRIISCIESLWEVEKYLKNNFSGVEISYFGSSFGAYILAIYLKIMDETSIFETGKNLITEGSSKKLKENIDLESFRNHKDSDKDEEVKYHKRLGFMRCAAVNFPNLVIGTSDPKSLEELEKNGYIDINMGGDETVRFTKKFIEELEEYDLFSMYEERPKQVELSFVHGSEDPVVDVGEVKNFAQKYSYPFTIIKGEDHSIRINADSQRKVADLAYRFIEKDR